MLELLNLHSCIQAVSKKKISFSNLCLLYFKCSKLKQMFRINLILLLIFLSKRRLFINRTDLKALHQQLNYHLKYIYNLYKAPIFQWLLLLVLVIAHTLVYSTSYKNAFHSYCSFLLILTLAKQP